LAYLNHWCKRGPRVFVPTNSERLTCSGFSIDETVRFGNFEFIDDYFGCLSRSSRRGYAGATFMGSTHNEAPTPRWAMIENSAKKFLTALSGEGSFGLPSPRRRRMGASLAPVITTTRMENAHAMMTVPLRTAVP
jgi:hypothetical protein